MADMIQSPRGHLADIDVGPGGAAVQRRTVTLSRGSGPERVRSRVLDPLSRLFLRRASTEIRPAGREPPATARQVQPGEDHLNVMASQSAPRQCLLKVTGREEQGYLALLQNASEVEGGYAIEQATKPQTLGYCLTDSPVGHLAWIVEKFKAWSDCGDDLEAPSPRTSFSIT